jgi:hypothetical protein
MGRKTFPNLCCRSHPRRICARLNLCIWSVFGATRHNDSCLSWTRPYNVFRNAVIEMIKTVVASSIQFCTVTPHTVNSPVNKSEN